MLERIENWHTALNAHINEHREVEFEWGQNDCALWAASAVKAITGIDFCEDIRGTYSTVEGAYKAIRQYYKVDQLGAALQNIFGEPVHIAYARQGDITFQRSNFMGFDMRLAICNGSHSFFITEDQGLMHVNTLDLDGCFQV